MGLADAFAREDRFEITVSQCLELMKEVGRAEMLMNGIKCDVPHRYLREMATGEPEGKIPEKVSK